MKRWPFRESPRSLEGTSSSLQRVTVYRNWVASLGIVCESSNGAHRVLFQKPPEPNQSSRTWVARPGAACVVSELVSGPPCLWHSCILGMLDTGQKTQQVTAPCLSQEGCVVPPTPPCWRWQGGLWGFDQRLQLSCAVALCVIWFCLCPPVKNKQCPEEIAVMGRGTGVCFPARLGTQPLG